MIDKFFLLTIINIKNFSIKYKIVLFILIIYLLRINRNKQEY